MSRRVPARRRRSNGRSPVREAVRAKWRTGQLRPRQRVAITAPRGDRTLSRVIRAPTSVSQPLMRTTGNGCSSGTDAAAGGSAPAAGGGANTGFGGTSKGEGAGGSAGVSSGTGVGVGVGAGVGSGAASMVLVGPDRAREQTAGLPADDRVASAYARPAASELAEGESPACTTRLSQRPPWSTASRSGPRTPASRASPRSTSFAPDPGEREVRPPVLPQADSVSAPLGRRRPRRRGPPPGARRARSCR
jgi:hypothetical protein